MSLTRRGWIAAATALAAAPGAQAQAPSLAPPPSQGARPPPPAPQFRITAPGAGTHDYTAALEALRAYALDEVDRLGLPGMTICVTDADGFTALLPVGWADVEHEIPLNSGHYFQIGSISKSFIALTVLALSDQGRVSLDAPVARYLPEAALPAETITVAQLLSHTAGLPDGAPLFPRTPDGRLWCGFKPGSRFSYSNTGFVLLGRIIERVTGLPHQRAVDSLVREKLGLGAIAGVISQERRPQFAVGYWGWDRTAAATLPGGRLEPALFSEEDNPAGSIGASPASMAVYLRALMRFAGGHGGPVLSDAAARRFATPVIPAAAFGPGARYCLGVAVQPVDGVDCLHHTGGMMSFASSFHADPAAGVGAFASVNAMLDDELYRPRQVTRYAVQLMRAARLGAALPSPPDVLAPWRVKDAAACAGTFFADARVLTLAPDAEGLSLTIDGHTGQALQRGRDRLVTDELLLRDHGLDAVREDGRIVGWWWGDTLFSRGAPRPRTPSPLALRALAGVYLNRDPWVGGAVVLARGGDLVLEGAGPLLDRGGHWTRRDDPGGLERFRFEGMLNGKAQRLSASGEDLLRLTV
jgi:CubicO group peptidase (beta-lactamase class C family)